MAFRYTRPFAVAAAATAALALSACAAPGFRADVARFQSQLPVPQGQTFSIAALDPNLSGGIEFGQYAGIVAAEMSRLGYRPAAPGQPTDMIVEMAYGVDNGRERIRSRPGFASPYYDPFYRGYFGYGGGYRAPYVVRGRHGYRYINGFYDPFLFGGYGGWGNEIDSYTVYTSRLDLRINRAGTGERLFEGQAEAQSRTNDLTYLVPNLAQAMFTNFPGNSGEKVRITIADPVARR